MKNIIKITIILLSVFVFITGCVKENFDTTPEYVTDWEANTTIKDLRELIDGEFLKIDTNIIIKGVVVSNDEHGNFYKELFIQDETGGIGIELDANDLFAKYPVGRTVYVKCNGLYLGYDYDVLKLGLTANIERINSALIGDYVDISAGGIPIEPKTYTLDNFVNEDIDTDTLVGSYIMFENVEFQTSDTTYVKEGELYAVRTIVDCSGNSIDLSTSSFATFGEEELPTGNGSIKAVLSKFDDNYQLRINTHNDVDFIGTNCAKK